MDEEIDDAVAWGILIYKRHWKNGRPPQPFGWLMPNGYTDRLRENARKYTRQEAQRIAHEIVTEEGYRAVARKLYRRKWEFE